MQTSKQRFEENLTDSCRIERSAVTQGTDLDMEWGTFGLVARQRAVKCLLVPLRIGDEMLAIGPMEKERARLFLPAGTDVERDDKVEISDSYWTVSDPPQAYDFRDSAHHIEAVVERMAMQDEY